MSISSLNNNRISMNTLQKYREKPLYEVPEQYFEQLQHDVMQRVVRKENQQKTIRKWISGISVAASITLIFILSYFIFENRKTDDHFYAHEETKIHEDSILTSFSCHLSENMEISDNDSIELIEKKETTLPQKKYAAQSETIAYRAVDFYVDDFETNNFCEVMYDLECYYDY